MQLQPRTFTLQQFNSAQYQYSPSETLKSSQSKHLQIYYKCNPQQSIIKLIEHIFSDRYLYQNIEFQRLLLKDKKGYVELGEILKQAILVRFIEENELLMESNKVVELLKKLSTKLICNHQRIRRKQPFIDRIVDCIPVYIEQYPQNDGNQQLQTVLSNATTIYYIKYNHHQNWALVYGQNANLIIQLNGHFWSTKSYFRVLNYQKARESFRNIFQYNDDYIIKDKYKENIFKSVIQEENNDNNNKYNRRIIVNQSDQINIDGNINRTFSHIDDGQTQLYTFRQHHYNHTQIKSKINKQILFPNLSFNQKYLSNLYIVNSKINTINDQKTSNNNLMQLQ